MVRKDLARRMEELGASYRRAWIQAIHRLTDKLGDDEFPQRKRDLLIEAAKKDDCSAPVFREWIQLAERYYPNVPWQRILGMDGGDEDQSG